MSGVRLEIQPTPTWKETVRPYSDGMSRSSRSSAPTTRTGSGRLPIGPQARIQSA